MNTHAQLKTISESEWNFIYLFLGNLHGNSNRVAHSARVNVYGIPFIREMPKITGVSGSDLVIKCPVAGYPIDKIHWERGKSLKSWLETRIKILKNYMNRCPFFRSLKKLNT